MNDFAGIGYHTITRQEWEQQTAGRTRDLTDRWMDTSGAERTRTLQATVYQSPVPDTIRPVDIPQLEPSTSHPSCGTRRGYKRHQDNQQHPCPACLDAHNKATRAAKTRARQRAARARAKGNG